MLVMSQGGGRHWEDRRDYGSSRSRGHFRRHKSHHGSRGYRQNLEDNEGDGRRDQRSGGSRGRPPGLRGRDIGMWYANQGRQRQKEKVIKDLCI